jgi:hypothetical protein
MQGEIISSDSDREPSEVEMIDAHLQELDRLFPDCPANVGWYSDEEGICTKIYMTPLHYLTTTRDKKKITHVVTKD